MNESAPSSLHPGLASLANVNDTFRRSSETDCPLVSRSNAWLPLKLPPVRKRDDDDQGPVEPAWDAHAGSSAWMGAGRS